MAEIAAEPKLSIIIPALNERGEIARTLDCVEEALARAPYAWEVLLVDGGSDDGTERLADGGRKNLTIARCEPGRARQMNHGASLARGDWLFFLHADSHPDVDLFSGLAPYLERGEEAAYCFELRFRSDDPAYRGMERGVAWRVRTFGLPYGDQGFCMRRRLFERFGGFRTDVRIEDFDLVARMNAEDVAFEALPFAIHTSVRQWDRQGISVGIVHNLGRILSEYALYHLRGGRISIPPFLKTRRSLAGRSMEG